MEWYGYVLLVAGLLIVAFIFFLIGMPVSYTHLTLPTNSLV